MTKNWRIALLLVVAAQGIALAGLAVDASADAGVAKPISAPATTAGERLVAAFPSGEAGFALRRPRGGV